MRVCVFAVTLIPILCNISQSQSSQSPAAGPSHAEQQELQEQYVMKGAFRPKLAMQDGLKIAEDYINKQHINISPYWLYRASFILSGDKKTVGANKIPGWHFWWISNTGAMGDYIETFVDMEGKANRLPSM